MRGFFGLSIPQLNMSIKLGDITHSYENKKKEAKVQAEIDVNAMGTSEIESKLKKTTEDEVKAK